MRMGSQFTEQNSHRAANLHTKLESFSDLVDRVNAQRFKSMVASTRSHPTSAPRLGVPFAFERPEVVAAHRELEQGLKPAAAARRSGDTGTFINRLGELPANNFLMAFGSFFGLFCAYAIVRSLK